jgi:hypothetical protein
MGGVYPYMGTPQRHGFLEGLKNLTPYYFCAFWGSLSKEVLMENARCNIELGNNRFVQATEWKDEIRIDVREWEIKDGKQIPTKKGISLPLHRWKMLVDSLEFLDQALNEKREYATHLGRNVYASVKVSGICVVLWRSNMEHEISKSTFLRANTFVKTQKVSGQKTHFLRFHGLQDEEYR